MTIKERVSFPTTTPEETMPLVIDFFKQYQADLAGIGIGSFGPIDIHIKKLEKAIFLEHLTVQ
ncbi:hypothetical protein EfmAA242_31910 (plasmid) [Enterococcus faecium]|nr:hypothetical protein EfmAA242_31910 [Enterococcus faecium]